MANPYQVESVVRARYSVAARERIEALCCPVEYDQQYLTAIPAEVLERDYGCGDPSRYLQRGETVLDLGSGAGKICFIAAQVVGPAGKVIGVDINDEMLAVARCHQQAVGQTIGWHNVEFRKGRIQDLALDLERLEAELREHPLAEADAFLDVEARAEELRRCHPLIASESIDVVVSNCVLNLVDSIAKGTLFHEVFRVLRWGGRAVISDIVSDRAVPQALQNDPELWSGCIAGSLTEEAFVQAFQSSGFSGVRILKLDAIPWRSVQGIHFRSMTIEAFKQQNRPGASNGYWVIYKGPFQKCCDEHGTCYERGRRYAVDDQQFKRLQQEPYRSYFAFIAPEGAQPTRTAKRCC
jgi:ubiquinone/menaquinone biosynthesis C-methylase UbiE